MDRIRVFMTRENLADIPVLAVPDGFSIRTYRVGEESRWACVEASAGEFGSIVDARRHFLTEFGENLNDMENRCQFLVRRSASADGSDGTLVGTATAWYGAPETTDIQTRRGRLHWVGIVPEFQGKGLAKPLVAHTLRVMARYHDRAYLTTQTTSYRAVKIYLDFGFRPAFVTDQGRKGWRLLAELLGHPALK